MRIQNKIKLSLAAIIAGSMVLSGCGGDNTKNKTETASSATVTKEDPIVIRLGHQSNPGEPFYEGCEKWKQLVEEKSKGAVKVELYPSNQLGSKEDLLDQMVAGEPICTLADGAYFYDRGIKDLGITFGPYLFDSMDEAYKLYNSEWFNGQAKLLSEKAQMQILASNWRFGVRHTLTTKPLNSIEDFKGLKIRVPTNVIQLKGQEVLGAKPTPMPLGEVYTALQQGTIDGVENPVALLYYGKFHEVAKYLLLDAHVYNMTTIVVGTKFYNSLSPDIQKLLVETCKEAGAYQNELSEKADAEILQKLKDEGVTVIEPSPEYKQNLVDTSKDFYSLPEFKDWSPNLYDTVKKAMQ